MVEDYVDEDSPDELEIAQATEQVAREKWHEDDIKRLITFFIDNKETFLSGTTKKIHLWVVACKTMLTDKKPISCEVKFNSLKKKYLQMCLDKQKGLNVTWPLYDLCHQAFHDDSYIKMSLNEANPNLVTINVPVQNVINQDGVIVVKKIESDQNKDAKVESMLNLYLRYRMMHKGHNMPRGMWDSIARELGEEEAEYWHKRFLNFKQHYIRLVYKRKECGHEAINWPYMPYFDQIYSEDADFQQKFCQSEDNSQETTSLLLESADKLWNDTEKTFLVKYYFDCFNEFQDPTIPKKFLWHEVGRLTNKGPDPCKQKYEKLKNAHFEKLQKEGYNLLERTPIEILFDNIIAKEVKLELQKEEDTTKVWKIEQMDELVQYIYNSEMVKDSVCYFVCWAVLAKKFQKSISACKNQWDEMTEVYKKCLEDKKEYPDIQISWRYIDLFDRIFDYGMDTNLLNGYKRNQSKIGNSKPSKVAGKMLLL